MIYPVEMYSICCDNCGENLEMQGFIALNSKEGVKDWAEDADWHFDNNQYCYCPDCYYIDDDDNLYVNNKFLEKN